MSPWLFIAAAVMVVVLLIASVVVFAVGTHRAGGIDDPSPTVRLTRIIAGGWAGFSVLGALATLLIILLTPDVTLTVPVQEFWPQLPSTATLDTEAARLTGGFTWASLTVEGVSVVARILWAISQTLAWLVPGAVAAFVALACSRLLTGQTFAPVVARMASATALVVALGGVATQVLGDIAGSIASTQLFGEKSGSWEGEYAGIDNVFDAWVPASAIQVTFPFWPIAAGLALAALAAIFRYGSRLQHEVKGLV